MPHRARSATAAAVTVAALLGSAGRVRAADPAPRASNDGAVGPAPAPAASAETRADRSTDRPPGHGMVVAGVAVTIGGIAAYGMLGAGLAIGNRADQDIAALTGRDDIDARRDLLQRGQLGNRLAIAGGIAAAVSLAVGIPLIVIGRRRAMTSARPGRSVSLGVNGAGLFVRIRL